MSAKPEIEPSVLIIGREGLKIPRIEPAGEAYEGRDVIRFFRRLWRLNGHPLGHELQSVRRVVPFAAEQELTPAAGKLGVVIKGEVIPTPSPTELETTGHRRCRSSYRTNVRKVAFENHSLFTMEPDGSIGAEPLMIARDSLVWRADHPTVEEPSEDASVWFEGEPIHGYVSRDEAAYCSAPDVSDLWERRFHGAVQHALQETVALLS